MAIYIIFERVEFFTSMKIEVVVLRIVTSCGVMLGYQCFWRPWCLHLQVEISYAITTWRQYTEDTTCAPMIDDVACCDLLQY
jgi:hypothetical protein